MAAELVEQVRRYRVLGTTDTARGGCECCGKPDLKVYVALEPVDGGDVVFMGTTCAARAEGATTKIIAAEAKAADAARRDAEAAARRAAQAEEDARWFGFLDAAAGPGEVAEQIRRLGGFAAASAAYRAA